MKFIAHLTYEDNIDGLLQGEARNYAVASEIDSPTDVSFTHHPDGMVFFPHQHATLAQKMAYYRHLDETLKKTFGEGISMAVAQSSGKSSDWEIAFFCMGMKAFNRDLITIVSASPACVAPRTSVESATQIFNLHRYEAVSTLRAADTPETEEPVLKMRAGIDYFVNAESVIAQDRFAGIIRREAKADTFAMTGDTKEKLGQIVAEAHRFSEGKEATFIPERYVVA